MSRLLYTIVFFCVFVSSFAQTTHIQEKYSLKVLKTTESIRIDAEETDAVWQKAQPIGDFWQQFPSSDKKTRTRTTVKAAFDNQFLYFLIEAYDSTNQYVAPNLKRDQGMEEQDGITVILDPVNKKTNGFGFSCTPNNVQSEFQFTPSFEKFNYSWDNKWFSAAKRYADKYVIEMAIPFKTLRFSSENTSWGVNFVRSNRKNNELSTWTNVPVQFQAIDLGYLGLLSFEEKLIQQKGNISLIPYLRSSSISESGSTAGYKINAGLDTKIAVTSSLNLDIAINPDFSQVDVDQQVTNLTRFSILFPERRTFFLENADLFTDFGAKPLRPFFSRRIGLNANAEPIPILLGVRLTGNLTEKTRIGVMNVQTGKAGDSSPKNYTATAIHQRIGSRSVIKGYFHNEESIGSTSETKSQANSTLDSRFGRNAGIELNLNNQSGTHRFWAATHTSIKDGLKGNNNFYQIGMGYFGRKFNGLIDFDRFENNYRADMGFINRLETFAKTGSSYNHADTTIRAGFYQIYNENNFTIRPKDKSLVLLILGQSNYATWFNDGRFSDRRNTVYADFKFRNTINALFLLNIQEDNLRYYFPLPQNKPLSPGNYRYNNLEIQFKGDSRKNVILNGSLTFGDYYNAKIRRYSMNLLIRKQPFINTTLSAEFNDLLFPEEYGRTKLLLAGPKIEATFTNKLFWTTFLQFNTQQNNFNINSRLQFRYSPMSDFFLVYSDNYYTTNLMNKNRAIIFKWNYWLTL